jgi:hypothetical protein
MHDLLSYQLSIVCNSSLVRLNIVRITSVGSNRIFLLLFISIGPLHSFSGIGMLHDTFLNMTNTNFMSPIATRLLCLVLPGRVHSRPSHHAEHRLSSCLFPGSRSPYAIYQEHRF